MAGEPPPWSGAFYEDALKQCVMSGRATTSTLMFGPLINKPHKTTVPALMRALPFMKQIVTGLPSLYVNGYRVENAVAALIKNDARLLETGESAANLAHDIGDHCMCIAKFLRLMKKEDEVVKSESCRYQLSCFNTFRFCRLLLYI